MKPGRLLFLFFLLLGLAWASPGVRAAEPDSIDSILERQLKALDTEQLDSHLRQLAAEYDELLPELSLRAVLSSLRRQEGFSLGKLAQVLFKLFCRELAAHSSLILRLLALALFSVLLEHLQQAFGGETASVAYLVCFLLVAGFALQSFARALQTTQAALNGMIAFMHALYPLLLTLILAAGSVSSAALFNPLLLFVLNTVSTLIVNGAVPMIFFAGVLFVVGSLAQNVKVGGLAKLLRDAGAGLMGLLFMLFVGFNIAQSTVGAVADGAAFRAGKFAVKTFLPVVGNILSDGYETIAGCTALVGNSVSFVGLMGVLLYTALPALRLILLFIIYRVVAALIEPLGGEMLAGTLNQVGGIFAYFFAALAVVGVMFFVLITVVIGSGNSMLMLR